MKRKEEEMKKERKEIRIRHIEDCGSIYFTSTCTCNLSVYRGCVFGLFENKTLTHKLFCGIQSSHHH